MLADTKWSWRLKTIIKTYGLSDQPQFKSMEELKIFSTKIVPSERRGGEVYIVGRKPLFKVGNIVVFHYKGLFCFDARIVSEPVLSLDPSKSKEYVIRVAVINWYERSISMSEIQELHISIHNKRISSYGGSILTPDELVFIRTGARLAEGNSPGDRVK